MFGHVLPRLQLEVTLTKKSPADWPELEGKAMVTATSTAREPPRPGVGDAALSASVDNETTAKENPTKLARSYSSTKDWDVVGQVRLCPSV